jgi:hypothetical protein
MSDEDIGDVGLTLSVDAEVKELMGLFDLPAFARRGQDVEFAVGSVHARCRAQREELLEMVRLRLRQWSRAATGPDDWSDTFARPIDDLWGLTGAEPPRWARASAPARQRQAVARDLVASLERFNLRWRRFLEGLNLAPANQTIDQYNQYYVLEKECVMGSARLAARHFRPIPRFTPDELLLDYPLLPVPGPA